MAPIGASRTKVAEAGSEYAQIPAEAPPAAPLSTPCPPLPPWSCDRSVAQLSVCFRRKTGDEGRAQGQRSGENPGPRDGTPPETPRTPCLPPPRPPEARRTRPRRSPSGSTPPACVALKPSGRQKAPPADRLVPREAFQPGDLAFPQISAPPPRAPRRPVFTLRLHTTGSRPSPEARRASAAGGPNLQPRLALQGCLKRRAGPGTRLCPRSLPPPAPPKAPCPPSGITPPVWP